jgi:predicted TIM-barrel fold metal-dependent hydrolase
MKAVDLNCLVGHWPFRKLHKNTLEDIQNVHRANNIDGGYVASLNSIFYNDPFEGDEELHEILKDADGYHHVLTINPKLLEFEEDIKEGIERFGIKGVRIYPGYHGYSLDDKDLAELCRILKENDLPLFLPLRMEDPRLNYIITPGTIAMDEVKGFLKSFPENKIILLTAFVSELKQLEDEIKDHSYVKFDTSGLKDTLFSIENLTAVFPAEKIVYGSLYPLYTFRSTYFLIKHAEVSEEVKAKILSCSW